MLRTAWRADQKHKLLSIYQNVFEPRQGCNSPNSVFVPIMWTYTQGWPDRSKEFTVNHFVPLFKVGDNASETTSSPSTSKQKETKSWADVHRMKQPKKQSGKRTLEQVNGKKIAQDAWKARGKWKPRNRQNVTITAREWMLTYPYTRHPTCRRIFILSTCTGPRRMSIILLTLHLRTRMGFFWTPKMLSV